MNQIAETRNKSLPRFIRSCGMRFPYDPAIIDKRIRKALHRETYEAREYDALRALVRKRDVVMELGGGIGFMSTAAARLCKARSVTSFEANPALIPYIRDVHKANGVSERASVRNAVLAGRKGKPVDFYVRRNLLASSMAPQKDDEEKDAVLSVEKVEVQGINTVIRELQPTVLICDIEGAEAQLLPKADLSCFRLAIVELHPQWIGQEGVQAVFDTMHTAGLTYFPWRSNKKVVTFRKGW